MLTVKLNGQLNGHGRIDGLLLYFIKNIRFPALNAAIPWKDSFNFDGIANLFLFES